MAKTERGYTKELMVLPFDHRTSFQKKMGIEGNPPTEEGRQMVSNYKMIIFEGFEKAVNSGLPKEKMGILTDEQFGTDVLNAAKKSGFTVCVASEKSGQAEFDFEYGEDFGAHIEKFDPDFVKVLVRFNTGDPAELNNRQAEKLARLSRYLDDTNRKYIFELLVPANEEQMKQCNGDKATYDVEMRPKLMCDAIDVLLKAGVEPDVWKLEGLDRKEDCEKVVAATQVGGRKDVGTIILGRGENDEKVRHWLTVGANVPGVIGFAVGRTVFMEPLLKFKSGEFSREQAVDKIADTYMGFCKVWLEARNS